MPFKIISLALGVVVATSAPSLADAQEPYDEIVAAVEALTTRDVPPLLQKAEGGDAKAQLVLGLAYNHGYGVQQDYTEAAKWCRKAAEQGLAQAQHLLGKMYQEGEGVEQDVSEAAKWLQLAAEQGFAQAQYDYGLMFLDGVGVPQDNSEAFKWFNLAAEQGSLGGRTYVGVMYVNGLGVPQNASEGLRHLGEAARRGSPMAQANVGALYANGAGVEQDNGEALTWLLVAEAGGFEGVQPLIAELRRQMTEGEVTEVQRRAETRYKELLALQRDAEARADESQPSAPDNESTRAALKEIGEWLIPNLGEFGTFTIDVTRDMARARVQDEVRIRLHARHTITDVWLQGCELGYRTILVLDPKILPIQWEIVLPLGAIDIPEMRVQAYDLPSGWRALTGGSEVFLRAYAFPAQFFVQITPGPERWKIGELSIPTNRRRDAEQLAETLRHAAILCGAK